MSNPMTGAFDPFADLATTAAGLTDFPSVAGVQLAHVGADGCLTEAAAGTADAETGRPVTTSTRLRPGSITKLLTATMVMQCVDDGLVAVDEPVGRWLPEAALDDRITVLHLVAHSSGIDAGDLFVDTGDDPGALERYAALLADRDLLFAPGATFSYCNAGFVLAGLLVARLRGETWEDVARDRVFDSLGMESTRFDSGSETDATFAAGGDVARGHLIGPDGLRPVAHGTLSADPMCTRGLAPAGATLVSTAADLARFAAAHLEGAAPRVLSAASARAMRQLHARAPGGVTKMRGVGMAWQVWDHPTGTIVRIGGANPGQSGVVALDPNTDQVLVALTNSDQGVNIVTAMIDGFGPAATADDEPAPADMTPYAGTYANAELTIDIEPSDDGGGLTARLVDSSEMRVGATSSSAQVASGLPDPKAFVGMSSPLSPIDRTTFASPLGPVAFLRLCDEERPSHIRLRMRALRRVG
ncbi:MAG TPA: serine hydrolase domain-containing protein [Acidimicrobiales bacterium]|jgi:CubicO group peptidase (beta-lactamase class C family)|nr:serine hydrolase domain-containing protein [Acidimicrobiales bacterium]